ncbi:MAG: alpha/beta fold hydrolase [Pseudonocardiaceae bacterium]
MREHEVVAADGMVLRAWRHGRGDCPILGVGTIPEMWPSLLGSAANLTVHSWRPRSTGRPGRCLLSFGGCRPSTVDEHVADAVAVLDAAGVQRCVVVGWSVGVDVGAALALQHPDRVAGLVMVAGVPGGLTTLPEPIRSPLACTITRALRLAGPVLDAVLPRLPVTPATVWPLRHSRLMLPVADPFDTARAAQRFLQHHWGWFLGLALAVAAGPAQDLRLLRCPVTVLAGRHDVFTDVRRIAARLAGVPQTRLRILPASHFIPLEAPEVVLAELRALQHRATAVEAAVRAVTGSPLTSGSRVFT